MQNTSVKPSFPSTNIDAQKYLLTGSIYTDTLFNNTYVLENTRLYYAISVTNISDSPSQLNNSYSFTFQFLQYRSTPFIISLEPITLTINELYNIYIIYSTSVDPITMLTTYNYTILFDIFSSLEEQIVYGVSATATEISDNHNLLVTDFTRLSSVDYGVSSMVISQLNVNLPTYYNDSSEQDSVYQNGYNAGYNVGVSTSQSQSYQNGYNVGYEDGYNIGSTQDAEVSFGSALQDSLSLIIMSPISFIQSVLNFDIFGFNIGGIVFFLLSLGIVIFIVRIIYTTKIIARHINIV